MKSEFFYHRKDGRDRLVVNNLTLLNMAIEPAYIARRIYAGLMKQSPAQAEMFRQAVIAAVNAPVTWDLTIAPERGRATLVTNMPFGETEEQN